MSFTADGQVHYYASEGVDDLTSDDYITSQFPYQMRCQAFNNFFFNVAIWENGRNWSTQWVIDDPKVFVIPPAGQEVASLYRRKARPQTTRRNQVTRQQQAKRMPVTQSRPVQQQPSSRSATTSRRTTQR
jgi:hypothetical protein